MDIVNQYAEYTNKILAEKRGGLDQVAKHDKKRQRRRKSNDGPLKIVYISSPMKVMTSESKFRSLVQELTGKDSQVAMFMETSQQQRAVNASDSSSTDVPVSSDQVSPETEDELGGFLMDGHSWELEFPWHLLME